MAVTPNFGLHQWQAGDAFLREEFNEDFRKIDGAVGAGLRVERGSFLPDRQPNRIINLGFRPKVLFLFGYYLEGSGAVPAMGILLDTVFYMTNKASMGVYPMNCNRVELTDNGFIMKGIESFNSQTNQATHYLAFV